MSLNYQYVTSYDRLGSIANEMASSPAVSLDLETTGTAIDGTIRLCSVNTGQNVYVIDLYKTGDLGPVRDVLNNPEAATGDGHPLIIGQNLKWEQKYLGQKYGIEMWPIFDTYRASALIHNGKEGFGHNLYDLYLRELSMNPTAPDLGASNWAAGELTKDQLDYAAEDVTFLPMLKDKLRDQLKDSGLLKVANIEFGVILPESMVELNGFYLDKDAWLELAEYNKKQADSLKAELMAMLPHPKNQLALPGFMPDFNLGSSQQVLTSLRMLGAKIDKTDETTLAMIAGKFPAIKTLLDWREYNQRLKTFGPDYPDKFINKKTGRVHCEYFAMLDTGRYSHSRPNLGQIPRAKEYRKCFKPRPGYVFVIADYSNIEMRIVAQISGDPVLTKVFVDGRDAHLATAAILTEKPESEIVKKDRQNAKPVNFGFIYGMQPPKLVLYAMKNYGVALTEDQAVDFRRKYFAAYRGVEAWHRRVRMAAEKEHVARSIAGRIRYLSEDAYNEYYNTPVQSTGADGLKAAMRCVYMLTRTYGRDDVAMVHHVHDEIVMEVRDDPELVAEVKHLLEHGMIQGMQPFLKNVPVSVEAAPGSSWADKA